MMSLPPESITCWHNDCSAGLRRPAAPLVPGQVQREDGWLPATVTNADGVPRTSAANRATRPKGSSAPVTGLGALPRTAIFATSAHVVTLHADIRAKRGLGLESPIQPQNAYSTSAQGSFTGSGSNGGRGAGSAPPQQHDDKYDDHDDNDGAKTDIHG